jgi:hypothetical protein
MPPRGRALICKGFTEFGVQRVVAVAMAVNISLAAGDGEGGPEAGADLPSALAISDGRRPVRGRGVCARQGRLAARPGRRFRLPAGLGPPRRDRPYSP